MSKTVSIGRLFLTTTLQAQGAPLVDRGVTHGHHQRVGDARVIRLPFCKHRPCRALVVGWWRKPGPVTDPGHTHGSWSQAHYDGRKATAGNWEARP